MPDGIVARVRVNPGRTRARNEANVFRFLSMWRQNAAGIGVNFEEAVISADW
jgi:hypothetical protein